MIPLNLDKKTGFISVLPFNIYDESGLLFYSSDFTDKIERGGQLMFNLPAGNYKYDGVIRKLDKPVHYKLKKLPPKERRIKKGRYIVKFGHNPNKCTIFYGPRIILFDNAFKKVPLYVRYSIYFHEMGHHFYKTEKYADLYAYNKMLKLGFNKTQIGLSVLDTLTNKESSFDRKEYIIKNATS
jgi:hypothetical protein